MTTFFQYALIFLLLLWPLWVMVLMVVQWLYKKVVGVRPFG